MKEHIEIRPKRYIPFFIYTVFFGILFIVGCYRSPHQDSDVYAYIADISDAPCVVTKRTERSLFIIWDVYFKDFPNCPFEVKSEGGMTAGGLLPSGDYQLKSNFRERFEEYYINRFYNEKEFYRQDSEIEGRYNFVNAEGQKGKLYYRWGMIYGDFHHESEIPELVKEMNDFLSYIDNQEIFVSIMITCCYPKDGYISNSYSYRSDKNLPDEIEIGLIRIVEQWDNIQLNKINR